MRLPLSSPFPSLLPPPFHPTTSMPGPRRRLLLRSLPPLNVCSITLSMSLCHTTLVPPPSHSTRIRRPHTPRMRSTGAPSSVAECRSGMETAPDVAAGAARVAGAGARLWFQAGGVRAIVMGRGPAATAVAAHLALVAGLGAAACPTLPRSAVFGPGSALSSVGRRDLPLPRPARDLPMFDGRASLLGIRASPAPHCSTNGLGPKAAACRRDCAPYELAAWAEPKNRGRDGWSAPRPALRPNNWPSLSAIVRGGTASSRSSPRAVPSRDIFSSASCAWSRGGCRAT